jgi:HEAT repeat protein
MDIAEALGRIRLKAAVVVPALHQALLEGLQHSDCSVAPLTWALGWFGSASRPAIPALIEVLKLSRGHSWIHRAEAADALGRIGCRTNAVMKALRKVVADRDVNVQEAAADAMKALRSR